MSATGIARRRPMPRDFPRSSAGLGFLWLRVRAELGRAPGGCGIVQRAAWLGFVRHPGAAGSCSVQGVRVGLWHVAQRARRSCTRPRARVRSVAGDELPRGTLQVGAAAQPQALAPRPAPPPGRRTQRHPRPAASVGRRSHASRRPRRASLGPSFPARSGAVLPAGRGAGIVMGRPHGARPDTARSFA